MKKNRVDHQGDLFGISAPEAMRQRIKDLDDLIKRSMKLKDFKSAKIMADEQAVLIRRLVEKESDKIENDSH